MENIKALKYGTFSRVASSVVHEMKNPLSAITLGMEYLHLKIHGQPEYKEVIGNISSALNRLDTMLENLHLFFCEANGSARRNPVHVSETLEKTRNLLNYYLTRLQVAVEIECGRDEPWLVLDESLLMTFFFLSLCWAVNRLGPGGKAAFRLEITEAGLWVKCELKTASQESRSLEIYQDDPELGRSLETIASQLGAEFSPKGTGPQDRWLGFPLEEPQPKEG